MSLKLLELTRLLPDREQPRTTMIEAELEQLKGSIRIHGLLSALRVRGPNADGNYLIVSGHRRHAALLKLGMTEAPCIIVDGPLDEATILSEQLAENLHRENLSPIEEAQGYRRYMTLKAATASQAAQELAVPASRISRALPLLELPENIQAAIHNQTIAKDTAYYLAKLHGGEERDRLFSLALTSGLARDSAVRAVKAAQKSTTTSTAIKRVVCQLGAGKSLTIQGNAVRIDSTIEMLEYVLREARKARTLGWEIATLTRVFKDRAKTGGKS